MSAPIVISIGTTHPWNVAGVGRDLLVGERLGARVFTAVAAVSAQDAGGVRALAPVEPAVLEAQLAALPWNVARAVRVGALGCRANVDLVGAALAAHPEVPVVLDPVRSASAGGRLADADAWAALREGPARAPGVILTPNLDEAAALLERAAIPADALAETAAALRDRGVHAVLLKGGHLAGDPVDVLADAAGIERFSGSRIAAQMRGTGCTLAMALACELAFGAELRAAVRAARSFVRAELNAH